MAQQLLIENAPFTLKLEEGKAPDGSSKYIVRGQFARSDRATENKRYYREHLWRREIGRLAESMKGRRAFGELDHPADGRTKLQRVSHIMTDLRIEGNEVVGEAEILDTPNGRILQALFKAGAQVGVSSRGYGSTKTTRLGSEEVEEVQEDFRLDTFDFVADPATRTAYPKVFQEEREHVVAAEKELTVESLRRDYPGLLKVIAEESIGDVARAITEAETRAADRLKSTFATQLRQVTENIVEEAYRKARSELESDPDVAGAKSVLENIVSLVAPYGMDEKNRETIDAKDAEIASLRQRLADRELEAQKHQRESAEYQKLAKEAGYRLHVERKLGDHPSKDTIVKLLGDVSQYKSIDDLSARVEDLAREFPNKKRATEDSEIDGLKREIADLRTQISDRDEKLKRAHEDRDEAIAKAREGVRLSESYRVQLGVERKIANFDESMKARVRDLCEGIDDEAQVDRIIASTKSTLPALPATGEGEVARIRDRVGRGRQTDLHEDTHGNKSNGSQGNGTGGILGQFGLMDEEFDRLAGSRPPR